MSAHHGNGFEEPTLIPELLEREKEVDRAVEEAREKAQRILQDAEQEARALLERGQEEAERAARAYLEKARKEIEEEAARRLEQGIARVEEIRTRAESRVEEGVRFLLNLVLEED